MERERERERQKGKKSQTFGFPFSLFTFPPDCDPRRSGRKSLFDVLSYRDKDRNKDVPALRREGETHTITEVEEGARKRENGQGCSYHVSPPRPPVLEGRKSLVTLPLSLFHTQPLFPPPTSYTH